MLTVTTDQYIFPPRSADAIPRADTEFLADMGWIGQLKYNDSRAIIKYCSNGNIELWNRHAEKFRSYTLPDHLFDQLRELQDILGLEHRKISMLDGGLLDQKHAAIKDTLVIWDILVRNNEHLIGTKYYDRYSPLLEKAGVEPWVYTNLTQTYHGPEEFGLAYTPDIFIPRPWLPGTWDTAWDLVNKVNGKPNDTDYTIKPVLEGLVFKDPNGTLEMGFNEKNNSSWMMRSRVPTGRHLF